MKVKTLREHMNGFGAKAQKAKGDEYEVPEKIGKNLVATGMVEEVKGDASTSSAQAEKGKGAAKA